MPPPRFIYVDPKFLSYHGFSLVCDHNLAAEAITSQQLQELNNRLQQLLEFSQISSGQPMNQPYRKHTPTRAGWGGHSTNYYLLSEKITWITYQDVLLYFQAPAPSTQRYPHGIPHRPKRAKDGVWAYFSAQACREGHYPVPKSPKKLRKKWVRCKIYKHENLVYKYLQFLFHHLHSRIWWFKYRDVCIWLHHGEPWSPLFPIQSC